MMSCREATRLISLSMDASLPAARRFRLRLHVLLCTGCARYEKQLLLLRELLRRPGAAAGLPWEPAGEPLPDGARERIKEALRNA